MLSIEIRVYVRHGYYRYFVDSIEQAVDHAETIMQNGTYRRQTDTGMEVHKTYKVKIVGDGLESEYQDEFMRT